MADDLTERDQRSMDTGRRLRVLWDGGSLLLPLPVSGVLNVGRGEASIVRIPLASVSRTHCLLHVTESIEVEDAGSSNGTEVGGRRLPSGGRAPLPVGVALGVGGAIAMVECDSNETEVSVHRPGLVAGIVCVPGSAFARACALADRLAPGSLSVLIVGETGVGKELIAERLRAQSQRAQGPFVRVNAAALPETLAESELFGHEKGAFTGATQARPGLIELADGGTLYLDELGELPLSLQPKLLRAVESLEVSRVGSRAAKKVSVRFVSATNRNLMAEIAGGRFRADLYHRLAAATIELPPLRARREEIVPLAKLFLARAAGGQHLTWSDAALKALESHDFPGNVRELRNCVERAVLLTEGSVIEGTSLGLAGNPAGSPAGLGQAPTGSVGPATDLRSELGREEESRIVAALERYRGNQTRAAEALGISRSTLLRRMAQYSIRH